MKHSKQITSILIVCIVFLSSCADKIEITYPSHYTDEEYELLSQVLDLPESLDEYDLFSSPFGPANNNAIATLGRVMFYDSQLSSDGTVSCASCHQQQLAFSDNVAFSEGVHGNVTTRNSIALGSLLSFDAEYGEEGGSSPGLFWDERALNVRAQMEETIANEREMGMDVERLKELIQEQPHYQVLFQKAFFDEDITTDRILQSIEGFIRSISSRNSKFDEASDLKNQFVIGDMSIDFDGFTTSENKGKKLFNTNCGNCHESSLNPFGPKAFTNKINVANNGLDKIYSDRGVAEVSKLDADEGKFKVPGLKNIALTAPYMHDGRFASLEEVVDFYNEGIEDHENLHEHLLDEEGKPVRMQMSDSDKTDLVAFLNTLTDETLAKESKWSDPFKK